LPLVQSATETVLFAHGRTAFWYGLQQLPMQKGQKILLPEYICEVILHPLIDLGIKPVYYPIDQHFVPDWDAIENIQIKEKVHSFLLVHYFGQPQDIDIAMKFCKLHGLWFIEDNSHGHGGTLKGQQLGSFGDMGFSSPHKLLKTISGGCLYKNGVIITSPENLPRIPISILKELFLNRLRRYPLLKNFLRRMIRKEPNFSDPTYFTEHKMGYYSIDNYSQNKIEKEDWNSQASNRRDAWLRMSEFAINNGLTPVWKQPHHESSPWIFPVYAPNKNERIRWLHEGWIKGVDVFPWPTLPKEVIETSPISVERWEFLFCFNLEKSEMLVR
jgi:perosamine synthetase